MNWVKLIFGFCVLLSQSMVAQTLQEIKQTNKDSIDTFYYIIEGDTIPKEYIDLEEVVLLNKLEFNSKADRRRYLILRRKTRKVYPICETSGRAPYHNDRTNENP